MKKALGGDRIGSGNKMDVELRNYERSTHDLGRIWRSTMASGTLVPFFSEICLNGDTVELELDASVLTHPTTGPLFGSFKLQLDVYQCPFRLYIVELLINKQKIGLNMANVKLPQIRVEARTPDMSVVTDIDNCQINPSCILSYLGIRGVGVAEDEEDETVYRDFNALHFISYWDIYKNYYANQQEEIGAVIHYLATEQEDTVVDDGVVAIKGGVSTVVLKNGEGDLVNYVLTWDTILEITYEAGTPIDPTTIFLTITGDRFTGAVAVAQWFTITTHNIAENKYIFSSPRPQRPGEYLLNWRYQQPTDSVTDETEPKVLTFPLTNLDEMRDNLVKQVQGVPYVITANTGAPYGLVLKGGESGFYSKLNSQEGLAIKTYQSDKFNNWMQTEWIDGDNGINELTRVSTADGGFDINTLIVARKLYDVMNRVAVSGGTYKDWNETVYDEEAFFQSYSPIYEGGLSKEIVFQEVVSTVGIEGIDAGGTEQAKPLGTLGGRGVLGKKHKGGYVKIKCREAGYIVGIASITPRLDYSQGIKWDNNLKTMDDLHKPGLDQIGFQDLITDEMAWWDTKVSEFNEPRYKSAGKQPSWLQYMTAVNETRGNFAIRDNEMFMTLNRRYEYTNGIGIQDLTTYIDPIKFNHIFAVTSRDAQNFWVQIGIDAKFRRKMSAKMMPNL